MLSPFSAKKHCQLDLPKSLVTNQVLRNHFLYTRCSVHVRVYACVLVLTCWEEVEEENMFGKGNMGYKYKKKKK